MSSSRPAACGKPAAEFKNDLALLGHEGRHAACRVALGKATSFASNRGDGLPPLTASAAPAEVREARGGVDSSTTGALEDLADRVERLETAVASLDTPAHAPVSPPKIRAHFVDRAAKEANDDGIFVPEGIAVDIPLTPIREVAREEIAEAMRTQPSPAELQRDVQNQARQAVREECVRSVREALANLDLRTRAARMESWAAERATRAAAEHVTPHLDALHMRQRTLEERTRRLETTIEEVLRRLEAVERERLVGGSPVRAESGIPAAEGLRPPSAPSPPENGPSEILGVCPKCGMAYEREEKERGFKRCVECGTTIHWMPQEG